LPTAVAATDFIPFTSITPLDNITYLDDKGIRGSMVDEYDVIQGNIHSEFEFAGDVFADSIGYPLAGVLGDVTFTSGTPNTHAIAVQNSQSSNGQPVTYTLSDYYGLGTASTRQYAGAQFESIDLKFSADAMLTYTAKAKAYQSATAANPAVTVPFPSTTPTPSWEGVVTLNSTTTAILADGNCTIQRPVDPIWTVDGTQAPYQLFAGAVTVSGAMTLVLESDAQLTYYLQNTRPALDIAWSHGTGASTQGIKLHMSKCAFTVAKIERGKEYVELAVTYKGLANTTDAGTSAGYSPIKVTLSNNKPTGTYA
jgi:hypothetical protein